jgi:hypothetical protein
VDEPEDDVAEDRDPTEWIRLALICFGLALNAWVIWDAVKERPEVLVWRQRWHDLLAERREAKAEARRIDLEEKKTVFEAIQIVEGDL